MSMRITFLDASAQRWDIVTGAEIAVGISVMNCRLQLLLSTPGDQQTPEFHYIPLPNAQETLRAWHHACQRIRAGAQHISFIAFQAAAEAVANRD